MKAKLIKKDDIFYLYIDESWSIASTDSRDNRDKKLSKQNCEEEFAKAMGVVDVEKLAEEDAKICMSWKATFVAPYRVGYVNGFNKAIELNKDKVFTLEEVHKLLRLVHILPNFELEQFEDENNVLQIDTFISHHIQQPKEIEVTFNPDEKDSEGRLILKKI